MDNSHFDSLVNNDKPVISHAINPINKRGILYKRKYTEFIPTYVVGLYVG